MVRVQVPGAVTYFFSSPKLPDQLWGPPSLALNWYDGCLPVSKAACKQKLTTHLHLVPRLRKSGTRPLLHLRTYTARTAAIFTRYTLGKFTYNAGQPLPFNL